MPYLLYRVCVPSILSVDLNLLMPLQALLEERHVSRAADRLRLSQPAMSRALQRLRTTLGDDLLVRGPGGYQLTPRAQQIQSELDDAITRLEHVFSGERFDPATASRAFRLAGIDYTISVLSGAVMNEVLTQSPGSTLHFARWHHAVFADAEHGLVDLLVHGGTAPPPLRSRALFEEGYSCLVAAGHPLAGRTTVSLDDYLDSAHVVIDVSAGRQGHVDRTLEALGRPRRASATVPYHAAAAAAVRNSMLVATLPAGFAAEHGPMTYLMSWHPRLDRDGAQRWLRDKIAAAAGR